MPVITPNYDEKPGLVPGKYVAKIIKCEMKMAKSGNDYLAWVLETVSERQWVYLNTTYSGKGAQIFKSVIKAAINPNYENGPVNTDDCIGREILIGVDNGVQQDGSPSKYMSVTTIEPAPVGATFNSNDIPF